MGEQKIKSKNEFNRLLRFSDEEIAIIKSFFAENDVALVAVRKVFLQKKLNELEVNIINSFNPAILDIIKQEMIPALNPDSPLHRVSDWWSSFDFVNMPMEKIAIDIQSRNIVVSYLTQQFNALTGEVKQEILFDDLAYSPSKNLQQVIIELNARGAIINHIEKILQNFKTFAGEKKETPEQAKQRLFQDSNK